MHETYQMKIRKNNLFVSVLLTPYLKVILTAQNIANWEIQKSTTIFYLGVTYVQTKIYVHTAYLMLLSPCRLYFGSKH